MNGLRRPPPAARAGTGVWPPGARPTTAPREVYHCPLSALPEVYHRPLSGIPQPDQSLAPGLPQPYGRCITARRQVYHSPTTAPRQVDQGRAGRRLSASCQTRGVRSAAASLGALMPRRRQPIFSCPRRSRYVSIPVFPIGRQRVLRQEAAWRAAGWHALSLRRACVSDSDSISDARAGQNHAIDLDVDRGGPVSASTIRISETLTPHDREVQEPHALARDAGHALRRLRACHPAASSPKFPHLTLRCLNLSTLSLAAIHTRGPSAIFGATQAPASADVGKEDLHYRLAAGFVACAKILSSSISGLYF